MSEANRADSGAGRPAMSAPALSLPRGGGAIRGVGEKFTANPVNGTSSLTVPIAVSPGRSGFGPQLSLSYDSGFGNGPFGFGWSLSLPSIARKTEKGLPRYEDADESDVFVLSGGEDLVPVPTPPGVPDPPGFTIRRYRPRIEGLFARIERWTFTTTGDVHWRSITRDNVTTRYGLTPESRIFNPADEGSQHPPRVFSWLICDSYDDKGNAIAYEYQRENSLDVDVAQAHERNRTPQSRAANRYLKRIKYGNTISRLLPEFVDTDWLFEVVFDYGEGHLELLPVDAEGRQTVRTHLDATSWRARPDPFSSYRAGFEVRTYRLCDRILMLHHFGPELGVDDYLVRCMDLDYQRGPIGSFLTSITQSGYVAWPDPASPTGVYLRREVPPLEFEYSQAILSSELKEIASESLENLPIGVDGTQYEWVDLDGDGISGILTEHTGAWFYKRNIGGARFGPLERVANVPALAHERSGRPQLVDLSGDGQLDAASFAGAAPGFYERTMNEAWEAFTPFRALPRLDWADPNLRFADLTGDGLADVLLTEEGALVWHPSLAEDGFGAGERIPQPLDEERGPRVVFADASQSIYLADLSGDGLSDLVRIRNGEVSYWPNLGCGRFGPRITMDNAPRFDRPEQFDQGQIRVADIDGSGTSDIIYLRRGQATIYRNLSGNGWSEPETLTGFPDVDDFSSVLATDLFGAGTACLVWSSPLPGATARSMRYVDLMAEGKPHLLVGARNNLGAETRIAYAPSTKFSLADREAGKPWITKLPFPVHVVERIETWDWISRNLFVSRFAYHHGYFDGVEREFRGFGMVEQWDTELLGALAGVTGFAAATNLDQTSHVPPVYTRTWFHTGVYVAPDRVSNYFAGLIDGRDRGEYYREPASRDDDEEARERLLDDTVLPPGLTVEEEREACRALKGAMLRKEIYALDVTATDDYPYGHPYTISEQSFAIHVLQRRGRNRHGVFFTHVREALEYQYERNPSDPRTTHVLTLDVDARGNVLKSASVGYGRATPDPALVSADQELQTRTLITYTESIYTKDLDTAAAFRGPVPCDVRTYELTGYPRSGPGGRFQASDFVALDTSSSPPRLVHVYDGSLRFDETPTTGRQRRLLEHVRTYYRPDDLGASRNDPLALLPLGDAESRLLPGETCTLALTAPLARRVFVDSGKLTTTDLDDLLAREGRYVHCEADLDWWVPSGRVFYSPGRTDTAATELATARDHFFLPRRYRDPFDTPGARTDQIVTYDAHDLLIRETRDAFGNCFTAGERDSLGNLTRDGNDYRTLQARLVMDPNGNRAAVAYDALGMVAGTAVMGKPQPAPVEGDSLDGFVADLSEASLTAFAANPQAAAGAVLGRATSRLLYDLFAYYRTRHQPRPQPAFIATLSRATHDSEPGPVGGLEIQYRFSYSDGLDREIQTKVQAEPGPVPRRDATGAMVIGADGRPQMTATDVSPRWVGSGWTVFNNKGGPVLKYEPFVTDTHRFEFDLRIGVSPVLFYDPLQRLVATLHPNGTYEKVIFTPWRQSSHDVNDTVTLDPRTDAGVAAHTRAFFAAQPPGGQTWLAQRVDPQQPPPDSNGQQPEQDAAVRSMAHAATPKVAHLDALGRIYLTIDDNGVAAGTPQRYETRIELDIRGNQRSLTDHLRRVVTRTTTDLLGRSLTQGSLDAGTRWSLTDITGKLIRAWDARGHVFRTSYDVLRRPIEVFVRQGSNAEQLVERTVYGEGHPQRAALNLRGRVFLQLDGAGVVTEAYDFKGNRLRATRRLAREYKQTVDWSTAAAVLRADPLDPQAIDTAVAPLLELEAFTTSTVYDALNRPVAQHLPDGSVVKPTYNEANLLKRVTAAVRGSSIETTFVADAKYDARGQRTRIAYGNQAITDFTYDALTFRLATLTTVRSQFPPAERTVQDLTYTYDPAGNITHIEDRADIQNVVFFDNRRVDPSGDYHYDALYRLTKATGREQLGLTAGQPNAPRQVDHDDTFRLNRPHPSDGRAIDRYVEEYVYDEVGNLLAMTHRGGSQQNPAWTRVYVYDGELATPAERRSNRLVRTQPAGPNENGRTDYAYDAHGNMTAMPHLPLMRWNFRDRLAATSRQVVTAGTPETTYYTYDGAGRRVRKVTESQAPVGSTPLRTKERIYVDGLELYREYAGSASPESARETLHVMAERQRTALVETETIDGGASVTTPVPRIRYQFGNHLGTASLELAIDGRVISYEEYFPYGSTSYQAVNAAIDVSAKRYRYTGKERDDENELYYHGARYLAPWLGRWISCDPMTAINAYEYVANNPIRLVDPDGKAECEGHPECRVGWIDYFRIRLDAREKYGQSIFEAVDHDLSNAREAYIREREDEIKQQNFEQGHAGLAADAQIKDTAATASKKVGEAKDAVVEHVPGLKTATTAVSEAVEVQTQNFDRATGELAYGAVGGGANNPNAQLTSSDKFQRAQQIAGPAVRTGIGATMTAVTAPGAVMGVVKVGVATLQAAGQGVKAVAAAAWKGAMKFSLNRGTFRDQVARHIANSVKKGGGHPLHFLVDSSGELHRATSRRHISLADNPKIIEAAHVISNKSGIPGPLVVMTAHRNQLLNVFVEGLKEGTGKGVKNKGLFVKLESALDIGGILVDELSALEWVKNGWLDASVVNNATRVYF